MAGRDYLTIGEVVQRLESNYPDLSISKVRFLEEEGLICPERTAGGYRKFSQTDLARVEMILRLQRDHFLPLAIIRDKLADADRGKLPVELQKTPVGATEPLPFGTVDDGPLLLEDAQAALAVPPSFIRELAEFGIVEIEKGPDGEQIPRSDVSAVHAGWDLRKFGVEPRHLRMYVMSADREAALFSQILMPTFRHRTPETRQRLNDTLNELCSLTDQLKSRLLRRALDKVFEDVG